MDYIVKFGRLVVNILTWKKGYRSISALAWLLILVSIINYVDRADSTTRNEYKEQSDYQKFCSEGDFDAAHHVLTGYYKKYMSAAAKWKSNMYGDTDTYNQQARYRAAAEYIFGQEMKYAAEQGGSDGDMIELLLAIPVEGVPLSEGEHGNGMFYKSAPAAYIPPAVDHVLYESWCRFYNDRCEQMFNWAIANDRESLARKVAGIFKEEIKTSFKQDETKDRGYMIGIVHYDDSRIRRAAEKIERLSSEKNFEQTK